MEEHLKDFVWMQKGNEEPVKVKGDSAGISQKMVAGFSQVFPVDKQKGGA